MVYSATATIAVLGDGGWGTALAIHHHRLGHRVRWWGAFPEYLRELDRRRENRKPKHRRQQTALHKAERRQQRRPYQLNPSV